MDAACGEKSAFLPKNHCGNILLEGSRKTEGPLVAQRGRALKSGLTVQMSAVALVKQTGFGRE